MGRKTAISLMVIGLVMALVLTGVVIALGDSLGLLVFSILFVGFWIGGSILFVWGGFSLNKSP